MTERGGFLYPASSVHTDLALEAHAVASRVYRDQSGVQVATHEFDGGLVSRVRIEDPRAALRLGKPLGNYITVEASGLREHDVELSERVGQVLAEELAALLPVRRGDEVVLVVGLGNWRVTPDSLGPSVLNELLVTRHLFEYAPNFVDKGMGAVCALAPGVLGITGIETGDIVAGVVEQVRPCVIIAIDALAAFDIDRLGTTIQIADTGISPGSGVGNKRRALNRETLGVPVIAVGAPAVVYANTIILAALDRMEGAVGGGTEDTSIRTSSLSPEAKRHLAGTVLGDYWSSLVVAPKEIDEQIRQLSRVIAGALNVVLHPGLGREDVLRYLM